MFTFTPAILKNLVNKPATRNYPFVKREPFKKFRGELYNDVEQCIFCGSCSRKCPSVCIRVDKAAGVWECDPFACVYCGICMDVCPTKCLHFYDVHRAPAVERQMLTMQGTPPAAKKKAAAKAKALAEEEALSSKDASKDATPVQKKKPKVTSKKK